MPIKLSLAASYFILYKKVLNIKLNQIFMQRLAEVFYSESKREGIELTSDQLLTKVAQASLMHQK